MNNNNFDNSSKPTTNNNRLSVPIEPIQNNAHPSIRMRILLGIFETLLQVSSEQGGEVEVRVGVVYV